MPQSQEYTDTFIITYKLFFVGLQGLYFISNPDGRPCMYHIRFLGSKTRHHKSKLNCSHFFQKNEQKTSLNLSELLGQKFLVHFLEEMRPMVFALNEIF